MLYINVNSSVENIFMNKDPNWVLFKNGNHNAFEKLYREHMSGLYDYGKRFSVETAIVEDCIQDMFIDLWNKREKLNDVENVKSYLFVTFKRRLIRMLTKNKVFDSIDENNYFDIELSVESIMEKMEMDREKITKLKNAFEKLSKNQQHILYLKFYQGFSNKEISEILQINYQSTRNALTRALTKLKTHFLIFFTLLNFILLTKLF